MEKCESKFVFRSSMNVQSGKQEWMAVDEAYDYHQEIARSAYADMLHDSERNEKYYAALKHGIDLLKARGEHVHLLDIGTGSGILAMMAVNLGADAVTACEVFRPMYECARRVLETNGMASKIKIIPKRSTELTVGPGCDLEQRANILIAEVFDTELIGEGAISTFNHAHQCLITTDAIVIPSRAVIYAQIVQSKVVRRWHQLFPMKVSGSGSWLINNSKTIHGSMSGNHRSSHGTSGTTTPNYVIDSSLLPASGAAPSGTSKEVVIRIPPEMESCSGTPSPHDLQLSQIHHSNFEAVSEPIPVLFFDFSRPCQPLNAETVKKLEAASSCYTDAVFFWWSLDMDPAGEIVLSCAPHWSRPDGKEIWRDHWLQAIYYPREAVRFEGGETVVLHAAHDEYSVWFDVTSEHGVGDGSASFVHAKRRTENSDNFNHVASSEVLLKRNKLDERGDRIIESVDESCNATHANNTTINSTTSTAVIPATNENNKVSINRPLCTCLLHIALGRSRIGAWNDRYRLDKYALALAKRITPSSSSVCLCLGDGNPLSLICAVLGAKKVFTVEPNSLCASVIERIVLYNNLSDRIKVIQKPLSELSDQDLDGLKPNLVVAEPEYSYTDGYYLPYLQSLTFWYALKSIRSSQLLASDAIVIPIIARLKMLAIEFEDLWKIRAPVGHCTGFDLTPLDAIIQAALEHADPNIEPQPLWEYPGVALSEEHTLMTFDFTNQANPVVAASSPSSTNTCSFITENSNKQFDDCMEESNHTFENGSADNKSKIAIVNGTLQFMCPGTCNGLAFWIEYTIGGNPNTTANAPVNPFFIISDGITEPISAGRKPNWSLYHRQGVHLFKQYERVTPARNQLRYSAKLNLSDGQMHFSADFESTEDDIA